MIEKTPFTHRGDRGLASSPGARFSRASSRPVPAPKPCTFARRADNRTSLAASAAALAALVSLLPVPHARRWPAPFGDGAECG